MVAVLALMIILTIAIMAAPALAADGSPPTGASEVVAAGSVVEPQQMWAWLVSLAVPFVTGLIVRKSWPNLAKLGVALGVSAFIGVMTVVVQGEWGGGAWVIVAGCFAVGQATFATIVNPTPLKDWLYSLLNHDPKPATS